jgi:hypothetical protein
MEILATNTDYFPIILGGITTVITVFILAIILWTKEWGALWYAVVFGGFSALLIFVVGIEVTYEAVVTDFNEVYEQGYEIISQNGKIVTLRKVGD